MSDNEQEVYAGVIKTFGPHGSVEVDPIIIEGIIAIGRELMNPLRCLDQNEAINISIEAREKLQAAATCLGLMDRLVQESADDSDKSWDAEQAHKKLKSMGEGRFKITGDDDA